MADDDTLEAIIKGAVAFAMGKGNAPPIDAVKAAIADATTGALIECCAAVQAIYALAGVVDAFVPQEGRDYENLNGVRLAISTELTRRLDGKTP